MGSQTINFGKSTDQGAYIIGKIELAFESVTDENSSNVTGKIYVRKDNPGETLTVQTRGTWSYSLNIAGNTVSGAVYKSVLDWVYLGEHSVTVAHNADGTKSISVSGTVSAPTETGFAGHSSSGSANVTLDTIPRASAFTYVQEVVELGSVCLFKWVPASAAFRYKLEFVLSGNSSWTAVIHPNTTSEYVYPDNLVLDHFGKWITGNPPELDATVVLHTYSDSNGTNEIGSHSRNLKITVPENNATKPTFTLSAAPKDTPIPGIYIQGKCGISVVFSSVDCKYGAGVADYAITVNGAPYPMDGSQMIATSGNATLRGTVTDSRGFSGSVDLPIYVHYYRKPRVLGVQCQRCDKDGKPDNKGTYLRIRATREYETLGGNNHCELCYRIDGGAWSALLTKDDTTADTIDVAPVAGVVLSVTESYVVEVAARDDLEDGAPVSVLIPTEEVDFHLREGGKGAAFGGYAEEEDLLEVWWRSRFRQIVDMTDHRIQNLAPPVNDADASTKGYVDGGCFTAAGLLMIDAVGDVEGYGSATVIVTGGIAAVYFSLKVTVAPASGRDWTYGIAPNCLHALNGEIPVITPVSGGLCRFVRDGAEVAELTEYGGTLQVSGDGSFWVPSRACLIDETDVGQWESSKLVGCSLSGVCFGTVTNQELPQE